jgi:hypothetical protein
MKIVGDGFTITLSDRWQTATRSCQWSGAGYPGMCAKLREIREGKVAGAESRIDPAPMAFPADSQFSQYRATS